MAYVIWRVFMKKYAKMRLGIQRGIATVNPAEPPIPPDPELWQRRDEFFSCEDQAAAAPPSVPTRPQVQNKQKQEQQQSKKQEQQKRKQDQQQQKSKQEQQQQQQQQEEQPVVERRKSGGRAKRVRSYLKKCRRAASGGSSSSQSTEEPAAAARTSSWYVEHYHVAEQSQEHVCEEHVCELPLDKVEVLRARDLYDDSANASAGTDGDVCDDAEVADELAAPESVQTVAPRDDAELVRGAQRTSGCEDGTAGKACPKSDSERQFAEEERLLDNVELRPGLDGPGDVLDSRNEGGTLQSDAQGNIPAVEETAPPDYESQAVEEISEDQISGWKCTADKSVYANLDGESAGAERTEEHREKRVQSATKCDGDSALLTSDSEAVEWHDARSETPEPTAAPGAVAIEAPIALPESGVPGLVSRHLGGVYPRFRSVRAALERQARDLLVVRYQGRLAALEDLFLRPAAALAAALLAEARSKGGDAIWAPGWPLTLGDRLVLHLGDVEGLRLRLGRGDCYCCVRPAEAAGAVEAALVWRGGGAGGGGGGGAALPVGSPMELPAQLRSLLASAERALAPDRLPLEAVLFPCKAVAGAGGCGCACGYDRASPPRRPSVPVRDSAMQTCPLFEVAGSLPHIDSDDDDDCVATAAAAEAPAASQQLPAHEDRSTSTDQECCPLVATPRSITEVPDRLLMAGITLPGTHDVKGRPLIMFDSQSVARASLDRHQVATLLLYYASIPAEERLSAGVCVLVASCGAGGGGESASLELVDQALSLLAAAGGPAVGCALLWRPAGRRARPAHAHAPAATLAASGVQYHVVSGEEALREFVAAEQAPAVCGGRCDHDQLEWVEFHKELEPLTAHAHACGRRLVSALQELRTGDPALASRRQLHAQQRLLARALADPELARLRADGAAALARLQQRAQWLPASQDVRLSLERAERLLTEVERASRRLETLCDARRERLRDLARLRALQHESEQVLSWLCQKGEETLRRHSQLATSLPAIKEQENDFEKFYFISMRHLDKGSDLLEECSGEARGGGLRELARSLKTHLLGFSERLEDTRERLEDTSRCFCLLDKAYEWALETMKYVSRVKTGEAATAEQGLQLLRNLRQYLMAHPPIAEDHFHEMLALARKLANDKLLEQAKVAQARCQETMELIREQQTRLVRMRRELGAEDADSDEALLLGPDQLAAAALPPTGTSGSGTTPSGSGRRRSLGAFPYIYKCSHHAEGRACSCCDPTPPPPDYASSATSGSGSGSGNGSTSGASATGGRLNGIREEEREGSEDGSKDEESSVSATIAEDECPRCDHQQPDHPQQLVGKRPLRRACTWQYPVESFEDEGVSCTGGDDKCGYSGGGSTTDGSDGCPKNGEDLEEHDNSSGSGSKPMPPVPVNSHLHCHTSNLNIQADSAKELKTQKTLLLIMREMIQTERDYVKSLEYVIQNYIPELLREDIPQALRGQRNVIFGNIEKIFEFHSQYFLQELERCENSPLLVGQSFLRHEKKFYLYALYNKNKPKSDSLMSEYGTSFFKGKQLELGDKMDLASYLLKPVQRMGKYALLLQQLMKAYPDKESEIADIRAAEQMVRFQLRHGNDLLAMDSLRDCDVNVKEQGRLLRQNEFLVWQGKGKKCLRHVFLFEELILFSKARRFPDRKNLDLYIYKNSIKMTDIGLTAKIGDSPTKFEIWFRKRKPNDTFTLQSMSEEIKQAWTEEISKLLWKQALRNREMRLAEMSSMGIGNKPCLDIRPSADQINDRSISIAQLSKTAPRFRNSITVAPGELSRNNKRPHSIISVSSSSSSAGSNSSHGTLHLGFESVDSPRAHHRSTTLHSQCSTESGIIADMSLGSEDADASHWHVERSNSSATSVSLDSSLSPVSPTEDLKTCLEGVQMKGQETTELQSPDSGVVPDEMSVKL